MCATNSQFLFIIAADTMQTTAVHVHHTCSTLNYIAHGICDCTCTCSSSELIHLVLCVV